MVITDFDYEKLINQVEVFKTRMEKLPEAISLLSERLKFADRVNPGDIPAEIVTMNSFVKINWMNTGIIRTINLVYPEYEDRKGWKISVFSSLGAALLGRKQGNETFYRIRNREFRIKIMELVFQPEAHGNYFDKNKIMHKVQAKTAE